MRHQRPPFRHKHEAPHDHIFPHHEPFDDESEGGVRGEAEYLRHLTEQHTPVVVHLVTGENFRGFIEYYDRRFIRLTREKAPNLFIFKQDIKYLCEE